MSKTLYLDCYSGISGDMMVGALLDLGADQQVLESTLNTMPVSGFKTAISRIKKSGLDVCDFKVTLEQDNHDHDMSYLHGRQQHESEHGHYRHHVRKKHFDEHRGLKEIVAIINQTEMTKTAKELACKIFSILADAEAVAHGVSQDQVHFHEVGAIDSIVDIVAVAVCLDNLNIHEVIVPRLCEGQGFVRCQHGTIPIPVPAVAQIAAAHKISLEITAITGELVTPTGAAIVAAVKTKDLLPETFIIEKIGMGSGKRHYDRPSLLRAMLIEDRSSTVGDLYKMESDIDDSIKKPIIFE